ncbi:uncharacterized protein LOC132939911 [Metopolophium dirhodum]|uniref:uncharacterized protein LOC132939911 n=1 Tax=Metopolophium dirhodum TaxID=44670 RepID=UPI0029900A2C|nr:uncharacterized protein LOC132939911 [Metopolophium dirhodum]
MDININPYNNHYTLKMLLTNNINGVINWLQKSANFGSSRQDGTPFNRMIVTRSWFDVYATTGLGKTKSASKMDCLIQITQLMKENFRISCLGSYQLPWNTKHINDLPNAIYIAENSSMFSKEQVEKLGILGYFLDTGNSKSPLEMLYDISNILITRPRVNMTTKNGLHVCKHYVNLYCSTGLGLTVEDAKTRSAEKMLNTLRKLCGFVQMFKLPLMDHLGNYGNEHRMCLCLPIDDQYKIKLIKYFLESPKVPHTVQLKELAAMLKVDVKYSDTGSSGKPGVACEFGPHVTVGVGATKMISVFRSRTAMLNELKLVCGFVQYPRTFVPPDCLDSTMAEDGENNNCYDTLNISFPNLLKQGNHPSNEMFPAEPVEYRDTTVSNRAETTAIPTVVNAGGTVEIVVQEGVITRGAFNPNLGPSHNSNSPIRPRHSCCVIRVSTAEGLTENSDRGLDMGQ